MLGAQDIPRALVSEDTRGVLKLVIDAQTRKVLGVHAAPYGAGELMNRPRFSAGPIRGAALG
ncbi:hypothetical protein [uncultured Serinicoccus sp.]|uniref:hypothetical protein n=1 Tax=uncultured Serinicoccus sp. TaxID=735514 RepID=UPI003458752F